MARRTKPVVFEEDGESQTRWEQGFDFHFGLPEGLFDLFWGEMLPLENAARCLYGVAKSQRDCHLGLPKNPQPTFPFSVPDRGPLSPTYTVEKWNFQAWAFHLRWLDAEVVTHLATHPTLRLLGLKLLVESVELYLQALGAHLAYHLESGLVVWHDFGGNPQTENYGPLGEVSATTSLGTTRYGKATGFVWPEALTQEFEALRMAQAENQIAYTTEPEGGAQGAAGSSVGVLLENLP